MKKVQGASSASKKFGSQAGISLIEVLVTLAIIGVISSGFASMLTQQGKTVKALAQKIESSNTKTLLSQALSNSCTCQLSVMMTADHSNDANLKFNATVTDGTQSMDLKNIKAGCSATSPIVVAEGQELSYGEIVDKVTVQNLVPVSAPDTTGVSAQWMGDVTVTWKGESGMHPITVTKMFYTDTSSPATARTISSCADPSGVGTGAAAYHVPTAVLSQYLEFPGHLAGPGNPSGQLNCNALLNQTGNAAAPWSGGNQSWGDATLACSRFCTQGCDAGHVASGQCRSVNAGPPAASAGFVSGFASECSAAGSSVTCVCVR